MTVQAHIDLADRAGATLKFGEEVLEWGETAGGVTRPHGERGTYTAGQLVICPGAWAPQLLAEFGIPITIERQVLYWLDPVGGTARSSTIRSSSTRTPTACRYTASPRSTDRGGGVKVAFFRKGIVCTPETIDRTVHDNEITRDARPGRRVAARP